jgi:hypothetical protein
MHSGIVGFVTVVNITITHSRGFITIAVIGARNAVGALWTSDITSPSIIIFVADALFALALPMQVANLAIKVLGTVEAQGITSHVAGFAAPLVFTLACTLFSVTHTMIAANRAIMLATIGIASHLALRILRALNLTSRSVEGIIAGTCSILLAQTVAGALFAEPATGTRVDGRNFACRTFPLLCAHALSSAGTAITMPAFSDLLTFHMVSIHSVVCVGWR